MGCAAVVCATAVWCAAPAAGRDAPPAKTLARLDEEFAAAARDLARRAEADGAAKLAEVVAQWQLPEETDRQFAVAIPDRLDPPEWIENEAETAIWNDFVAAR